MLKVDECNANWIEERERLVRKLDRNLAGPFLGYRPVHFERFSKNILYVGKATEQSYGAEHRGPFSIDGQVQLANTIFHEEKRQQNPASFWGFAKQASLALEPDAKRLANLAWANVSRVGELCGSPASDLIREQHTLALETIRAEIAEWSPRVILFVCNHDGDALLGELCADSEQLSWSKSEHVWWRNSLNSLPPMVWMRHPQSCPAHIRELSLSKLCELV